eukprot:TRINITY_DN740_c4_g1_i1.p1 TRINITY_DN740_c4_g1~~TRINITY_DN740_c4_g1_i1.p1  ORF type:complete len:331 (+),score=118.94 TRINITY_DN740_c4_g1_i1:132-1124(+)
MSSEVASSSTDTIQDIREILIEATTWLLVISILCAFATIITFVLFKNLRTYPIKLVLYVCVCIIFGYSAIDVSNRSFIYDVDAICIMCAICIHYFLLGNFFWSLCIAFNFYQMIVRRNREVVQLEKWYHLFSWGMPIPFVVIVGGFTDYGALGSGSSTACYITNQWVSFGTFFIPGFVVICLNCILFFIIGREIRETLGGAPKVDQRDRKQEFKVYISIFISLGLSWIFGYIDALFKPKNDVLALIFFIIFTIATPLQGTLIFFFYCLNNKVGIKWTGLFAKVLPFCKPLNEYLQKSESSTASRQSTGGASAGSSSRGINSVSSRTSSSK